MHVPWTEHLCNASGPWSSNPCIPSTSTFVQSTEHCVLQCTSTRILRSQCSACTRPKVYLSYPERARLTVSVSGRVKPGVSKLSMKWMTPLQAAMLARGAICTLVLWALRPPELKLFTWSIGRPCRNDEKQNYVQILRLKNARIQLPKWMWLLSTNCLRTACKILTKKKEKEVKKQSSSSWSDLRCTWHVHDWLHATKQFWVTTYSFKYVYSPK